MGKSIGLGLILLLFWACQGNLEERAQKQADSIYISAVNHERQQKDDAFAMSANSPFRDVKEEFTGLQYYPVSSEWKVNCTWDKSQSVDTAQMPDSKGTMRTYQRAGTFKFRLKNRNFQIPAYFEDSAKTLFFVMFRDSSNSTETYQGGRYIEFQHAGGNEIVIDFNRAFNPYCHYNQNYACPVVPPSHFIPLFIRAGERRFGGM